MVWTSLTQRALHMMRTQASSFDLRIGTGDFKASVRPVLNDTRDSGTPPARFWELTIDMTGYQAPTDVGVRMVAHALGVSPPNAACSRIWHQYVPRTAASQKSVLQCSTGLYPRSAVRRGESVVCSVAMLDSFGDSLKGVVGQFHAAPRFGGTVSPMAPSSSRRASVFNYTPPALGDVDKLDVTFSPTNVRVANGSVNFDVVDYPGPESRLHCVSASWPPSTVVAGDAINCSIVVVKSGGGLRAKAVASDFVVNVTVNGHAAQVQPRLHHSNGGYAFNFTVTAPPEVSTGNPTHTLTVHIRLRVQSDDESIQSGRLEFDVAHTPLPTASQLRCTRVERVNEQELAAVAAGVELAPAPEAPYASYVQHHETVACVITGRSAGTQDTFPAKTLASHYTVSADWGTVSDITASLGGHELEFR